MIGARVMWICLCFFFFVGFFLPPSLSPPSLTSHCNVPPLRSTRFISVASSPEQGNIHTYIHISSFSGVCRRQNIILLPFVYNAVYPSSSSSSSSKKKNGKRKKNLSIYISIDSKQNAFVAQHRLLLLTFYDSFFFTVCLYICLSVCLSVFPHCTSIYKTTLVTNCVRYVEMIHTKRISIEKLRSLLLFFSMYYS